MDNNIKNVVEKIKERKISVNITLDESLLKKIEAFNKENGIQKISPTINEMVADWLKANREAEEEVKRRTNH